MINKGIPVLELRNVSKIYDLGQVKVAALKNINLKILSALIIPVPPLSLQKEFAQRVAEIRKLEVEQAASRAKLDSLFQSMLHRAFNGEL